MQTTVFHKIVSTILYPVRALHASSSTSTRACQQARTNRAFSIRQIPDRLVHIGSSQSRGFNRCRWCHGDLEEICGGASCTKPQTRKKTCLDGRSRKSAHAIEMKCSSGSTRKTTARTRCIETFPAVQCRKDSDNSQRHGLEKCRTNATYLEVVWQTDNGNVQCTWCTTPQNLVRPSTMLKKTALNIRTDNLSQSSPNWQRLFIKRIILNSRGWRREGSVRALKN